MPENRFRVLLVEDDPVLRRGLARMFSQDQAVVTQAADGRQAVNLIGCELYDLIISDLRLPEFDGLNILSRLRSAGRNTPFILMTAYYSDDLAKRAESMGANAVFEKPIELKRIAQECAACLGRSLQIQGLQ